MKSTHATLAELLNTRIEQLPTETVIVPVPTIARHIRQRGYDHAALLARSFARKRHLTYQLIIKRNTTTSQRNASRQQRFIQAKEAFVVRKRLSPLRPYLLVDDIVTTGATLRFAAQALRDAGATDVWIAAVARQPLD